MSFWIPILFLIAGLSGLAILIFSRLGADFIDENLLYPLGLCAVLVIGGSSIFIGLNIITSESQLWAALGAFLFVSGFQITLWIVGIRLDFLGNQSTFAEPWQLERHRRLPFEYRHSRYLEEYLQSLSSQERVARLSPELIREVGELLSNPIMAVEFTPLLRELVVSVERLRMQEGEERWEEAHQRVIEAVANLRAEIILNSLLL
jgi:hypothetical protein